MAAEKKPTWFHISFFWLLLYARSLTVGLFLLIDSALGMLTSAKAAVFILRTSKRPYIEEGLYPKPYLEERTLGSTLGRLSSLGELRPKEVPMRDWGRFGSGHSTSRGSTRTRPNKDGHLAPKGSMCGCWQKHRPQSYDMGPFLRPM